MEVPRIDKIYHVNKNVPKSKMTLKLLILKLRVNSNTHNKHGIKIVGID